MYLLFSKYKCTIKKETPMRWNESILAMSWEDVDKKETVKMFKFFKNVAPSAYHRSWGFLSPPQPILLMLQKKNEMVPNRGRRDQEDTEVAEDCWLYSTSRYPKPHCPGPSIQVWCLQPHLEQNSVLPIELRFEPSTLRSITCSLVYQLSHSSRMIYNIGPPQSILKKIPKINAA